MNGRHGNGQMQRLTKKSYNAQTNYKHYEDMKDYHWAMFTHAIDLFQEWASLKT
jgi:hypothetical protein